MAEASFLVDPVLEKKTTSVFMELKDIGSRWELVKRLDEGESQRKIAKDLHLSLCKITRGSKELKKKNAVLKRFIERLNK